MLFKKMVLFAIIAIFDHYYKFCDVFKVKFERKTIRNVPKCYRLKYEILYPNCQFFPHYVHAYQISKLSYKSSTGSQGRKTRDDLFPGYMHRTKLFHMWSGHVFNMKTWFQLHFLILCCFAMLNCRVWKHWESCIKRTQRFLYFPVRISINA